MRSEWIIAGFGGQGVLFAGDLLARAAIRHQLQVTYMPTYGVAMRGGTANCVLHLSDESIGSPLFDEPDVAIILNQQSFDKFQPLMKPGGLIVGNSSIINPETFTRMDDLRVVWAPFTEIARNVAGTERSTNMAAIGAFLAADDTMRPEIVADTLREEGDPSKRHLVEKNIAAMHAGMDAVHASAL